jgi:hypothetical protein
VDLTGPEFPVVIVSGILMFSEPVNGEIAVDFTDCTPTSLLRSLGKNEAVEHSRKLVEMIVSAVAEEVGDAPVNPDWRVTFTAWLQAWVFVNRSVIYSHLNWWR